MLARMKVKFRCWSSVGISLTKIDFDLERNVVVVSIVFYIC